MEIREIANKKHFALLAFKVLIDEENINAIEQELDETIKSMLSEIYNIDYVKTIMGKIVSNICIDNLQKRLLLEANYKSNEVNIDIKHKIDIYQKDNMVYYKEGVGSKEKILGGYEEFDEDTFSYKYFQSSDMKIICNKISKNKRYKQLDELYTDNAEINEKLNEAYDIGYKDAEYYE